MLAAAIFAKPNLLLLGKPIKHLLILAVTWLARALATSKTWQELIKMIMLHNCYFTNKVCTDCLHISKATQKLA